MVRTKPIWTLLFWVIVLVLLIGAILNHQYLIACAVVAIGALFAGFLGHKKLAITGIIVAVLAALWLKFGIWRI